MGFRCPICKKDFGTEKEEFQKHIDLENYQIDLKTDLKTLAYINSNETFKKILAVENEVLEEKK